MGKDSVRKGAKYTGCMIIFTFGLHSHYINNRNFVKTRP